MTSRSSEGSGALATSMSLLERARADDAEAWDRLVRLYAPLVHGWCRRSGLQDDDADDVFQEVFLAVATHLDRFRGDRPADTFRGWLATITRNKVRDCYRLRQKEPPGRGGTEAQAQLAQCPATARSYEDTEHARRQEWENHALLQAALDSIRSEIQEHTWHAFWRTAVEDRPATDVAEELAMTPGAVRVAKSRVLHRLRSQLDNAF